jgi:hypothetical protein
VDVASSTRTQAGPEWGDAALAVIGSAIVLKKQPPSPMPHNVISSPALIDFVFIPLPFDVPAPG